MTRTTVDAIRIDYDRRTDIRSVYPGTRPTRLPKDDITIVEALVGWAPYTHLVTVPSEFGDDDYYHAIIPEDDPASCPWLPYHTEDMDPDDAYHACRNFYGF